MNTKICIALVAILSTFSFAKAEDPEHKNLGESRLGTEISEEPQTSRDIVITPATLPEKEEARSAPLPAPLKEAQVKIVNIVNSCCPCPKRTTAIRNAGRSYQQRFRSNPYLPVSTVKAWEQKLEEMATAAVNKAVDKIVHNRVNNKINALAPGIVTATANKVVPGIVKTELNKQLGQRSQPLVTAGAAVSTAPIPRFTIDLWYVLLGLVLGLALFLLWLFLRAKPVNRKKLGPDPVLDDPLIGSLPGVPAPPATSAVPPVSQAYPVGTQPNVAVAVPVEVDPSVSVASAPGAGRSSEGFNAAPDRVLDTIRDLATSSALSITSSGSGYEIRSRPIAQPAMAAAVAGVPGGIHITQNCGCSGESPKTRTRTTK